MSQPSPATTRRLDVSAVRSRLHEAARRHGVPGAALGVSHGDEEVIAVSGVTSTRDPLPICKDTPFRIASISKTYVATIAVILRERGLLDFDRHLAEYLPALLNAPEQIRRYRAAVHVRDLFTHTAGWLGDVPIDTGEGDDAFARVVDVVLPAVPHHLAPGTQASYNNTASMVASRLFEVVTNTGYEQLARELLLDPLGMTQTFTSPLELVNRRHAIGHSTMDGQLVPEDEWDSPRGALAAGGMSSSPVDQLAYGRAHLRMLREGGIITAEGAHDMITPRVRVHPDLWVGIGWMLTQRPGGPLLIGHEGNAACRSLAQLLLVPELDLVVTVLTNSWGGRALISEMCDWVLDDLMGAPLTIPAVDPTSAGWDEFVGVYACADWRFDVRRIGDRMRIDVALGDVTGLPDLGSDVVLRGDALVAAGDPRGTLGEFVRSADGSIDGLVWAQRFARRVREEEIKEEES